MKTALTVFEMLNSLPESALFAIATAPNPNLDTIEIQCARFLIKKLGINPQTILTDRPLRKDALDRVANLLPIEGETESELRERVIDSMLFKLGVF